jgi:oxygen-independent coproporphyrinogen-3 oxidase
MAHSAYVHIPFCANKCDFCDFAVVVGRDGLIGDYCRTVCREIAGRTAESAAAGRLASVFYGGGTPGYISAGDLALVHDALEKATGIAADAEITLETTPETVTPASARAWLELGVNRLSIGVESLDDSVLAAAGRKGTRQAALGAIGAALEAGFANVSLDLMYGLPGQTLKSWVATLEETMSYPIQHLSAYGLALAPGSPLLSRYPRGDGAYPDEELYLAMYEQLVAITEQHGFVQYEISNFSRPGFQCRHNLTYWDNEEYFGFGLGAHRYVQGVRSSNFRSLPRYMRDCLSNDLEERIDAGTRAREAIFLGLRKRAGIDLAAFRARYGMDLLQSHGSTVEGLGSLDLLELVDGHLRLTQKGVLVSNTVMSEFM